MGEPHVVECCHDPPTIFWKKSLQKGEEFFNGFTSQQ
jgi:hypothetical protein